MFASRKLVTKIDFFHKKNEKNKKQYFKNISLNLLVLVFLFVYFQIINSEKNDSSYDTGIF